MGCGAGSSTSSIPELHGLPPSSSCSASGQMPAARTITTSATMVACSRTAHFAAVSQLAAELDRVSAPPYTCQSQRVRDEREDGRDDENSSQWPANLHRCLVKPPTTEEAHGRWNAQHGQHAKQESKGCDRVARGQSFGSPSRAPSASGPLRQAKSNALASA